MSQIDLPDLDYRVRLLALNALFDAARLPGNDSESLRLLDRFLSHADNEHAVSDLLRLQGALLGQPV